MRLINKLKSSSTHIFHLAQQQFFQDFLFIVFEPINMTLGLQKLKPIDSKPLGLSDILMNQRLDVRLYSSFCYPCYVEQNLKCFNFFFLALIDECFL